MSVVDRLAPRWGALPATVRKAVVPLVAGALLAAGVVVLHGRGDVVHVTAHLPRAVSLYPGSDVRVLGVRIGEVTAVRPEGRTVRVDMEYAAEHKVPAEAKAVVVSPSVVADRYVQLTPAWTGGPRLADGSDIPESRTAVPVELDRIFASLNDLNVALGPQGANKGGALTRLLDTGARNLDGQGTALHGTISDLSTAVTTLAESRGDLFGTVRNLQAFTTALARSDAQVRSFNQDLAGVSDQLAGEREELAAALRNLAVALGQVATFVRDNRTAVKADVAGLAQVTGVLVRQKAALEEFLDVAPTTLSNLQLAYNASSGTLDTRNNARQSDDPRLALCSLLRSAGLPQSVCDALAPTLAQLPLDAPAASPGSAALPGTVDRTLGGILGGAQ